MTTYTSRTFETEAPPWTPAFAGDTGRVRPSG